MNYPLTINPYEKLVPEDDEIEKILNQEYYELCLDEVNKKFERVHLIKIDKPQEPVFEFKYFNETFDSFFMIFFGLICMFYIMIPLIIYEFFRELRLHFRYIQYYNEKKEKYLKEIDNVNANNTKYYAIEEQKKKELNELMKKYKDHLPLKVRIKKLQYYDEKLKNHILNIELYSSLVVSAKKGISESYFFSIISKNTILTDYKVLNNTCFASYYPDFVFIHKSGIFIDVEIDEPYVGNSKEVIHFYNRESDCFNDDYRNRKFASNGWIVIRFSENQIFKDPVGCLNYIDFIVNDTLKMKFHGNETNPYITPEKIWTKDVANEMAAFDYRKTYIPDNYKNYFN